MSKLKIGFKVMSDVQKWPATFEACDRLNSDPSLSEADRALVAQMRQALTQRASGVTLKRPGESPKPIKPKDEGPSTLRRIPNHPGEILFNEFLTGGRTKIPGISAQALLDLLHGDGRITPRLAKTLAAALNTSAEFWLNLQSNYDAFTSEQVILDRDITAESIADYEAGKTFSWDELLSKIDAGPHWDEALASLEMDRAMATQGLNREALALLALLGLSGEDVAAGRVSTLAEALSKIRGGDPIPADIRAYIQKKHKKPAPPSDMEGVMSELECLRIEVEELRADRDHWMGLWQRAANELLRRSPPSTIKLPGAGDQMATVLNILDLGKQAESVLLDSEDVRMSVRLRLEGEEGLPADVPHHGRDSG